MVDDLYFGMEALESERDQLKGEVAFVKADMDMEARRTGDFEQQYDDMALRLNLAQIVLRSGSEVQACREDGTLNILIEVTVDGEDMIPPHLEVVPASEIEELDGEEKVDGEELQSSAWWSGGW